MNEELERVLSEQLHSAKRRLKSVKRMTKMMPDDPNLPLIKAQIEKSRMMIGNLCMRLYLVCLKILKPRT